MRKSNSFCSTRNRICRAFQLPITCGHYIAECHLPTFYAHIISVIMCEKYFCARCIAECAILPRHCEYQEKLFGKTPSRFYFIQRPISQVYWVCEYVRSGVSKAASLALSLFRTGQCFISEWSTNQYFLSYYPRDASLSLTLKCLLLPCICL